MAESIIKAVILLLAPSLILGQEYSYEAEERAPRYIAQASEKVAVTPVPILKQVNRHNEDGSYTYGFEAADGSFKIETKLANGEVKGKYGYKDDTGKVRVIEYGANKYGFQPSGEGITVAPPNLVDEPEQPEEQEPEPAYVKQYQPQRPQRPRPVQQYQQQSVADYDFNPAPAQPQGLSAYRAQTEAVAYDNEAAYRRQFEQPRNYGPRPQKIPAFAGAIPAQPAEPTYFKPAPTFKQNLNLRAPPNSLQIGQPAAPVKPYQYSQTISYGGNQQYQEQPIQQQPQPVYYQQPAAAPREFNKPQKPFTMLDQLIKEYGLPQGGAAPLHDITFGVY